MFHEVKSFNVYFLTSAFSHNVVLRFEIMHSCGGSTSGPFFSAAQYCSCWGLFTQSRVDGRLGYCQLGAATNNALISIVPKSSYGHMLSFIQGTPSKGMNRLHCRCTFKFLGNRKAASQGTCVILCSHQPCMSSRSAAPHSMLGIWSSSLFLPSL